MDSCHCRCRITCLLRAIYHGGFLVAGDSAVKATDSADNDEVDLKCKERVCDSETETENEDAPNESSAFLQQRFSPGVMLRHQESDVTTYKPKPIKIQQPTVERVLKVKDESQPLRLPVNASMFQKTGAVFKDVGVKSRAGVLSQQDAADVSRPSSTKSDSAVQFVFQANGRAEMVTKQQSSVNKDMMRSTSLEGAHVHTNGAKPKENLK